MEFMGVISQIIILFLVVCVGYFCGKLNYFVYIIKTTSISITLLFYNEYIY